VWAPARADWQYTRWGMTPEQVVAASHGNALLVPKTRKNDDRLALGIYKVGHFEFAVFFKFGKYGLSEVELSDVRDKKEVLQALQEKYGMWSPGTIWIDHADNFSVGTDEGEFTFYRPLHDVEKRGL